MQNVVGFYSFFSFAADLRGEGQCQKSNMPTRTRVVETCDPPAPRGVAPMLPSGTRTGAQNHLLTCAMPTALQPDAQPTNRRINHHQAAATNPIISTRAFIPQTRDYRASAKLGKHQIPTQTTSYRFKIRGLSPQAYFKQSSARIDHSSASDSSTNERADARFESRTAAVQSGSPNLVSR